MADRDPEIEAIEAVISALEPLDEASRDRVIAYAGSRLGMEPAGGTEARTNSPEPVVPKAPIEVTDIRTLRDQKQPQSANEMAALVAYYLSEKAPASERKAEVATADLTKYFKQAGHPLPKKISATLPNAAAAGYFDGVGSGQYRLNPVGHNLVAHGLPSKARPASGGGNRKAASTSKKLTPQKKGNSSSKRKK